jgi:hemoglobin-like flavoprotein
MLTSRQKQIVQSTFIKVTLVSNQAGEWFYKRLFELSPEIKPLFSNTNMHIQSAKLMQMIATAVTSLDHLDELRPTLGDLGRRHVTYGVRPEHYPIVGQALVFALAHVLGAEFTAETEEAWKQLYSLLVSIIVEENTG